MNDNIEIEINLKENFYHTDFTSNYNLNLNSDNKEKKVKKKIKQKLVKNNYKCQESDKHIKKSKVFYAILKDKNIIIVSQEHSKKHNEGEIIADIEYIKDKKEENIIRSISEWFKTNNAKVLTNKIKTILKLFIIFIIVSSIYSYFILAENIFYYEEILLNLLIDINVFDSLFLLIIYIIGLIILFIVSLLNYDMTNKDFYHHYYQTTRRTNKFKIPYVLFIISYIIILTVWLLQVYEIINEIGRINITIITLLLIILILIYPKFMFKIMVTDKSRILKNHNKEIVKNIQVDVNKLKLKQIKGEEIENVELKGKNYNIPTFMFIYNLISYTFIFVFLLYIVDNISLTFLNIILLLPLLLTALYYARKFKLKNSNS